MCPQSNFGVSSVFRGPTTPAAVCLRIIRLKQPVTRTHLFEHSTHSQPTIARAVMALINAQLVRERPDKITAEGPGRPKIPLEMTPTPWVHVGVALGTKSTYLGIYGTRGQLLREQFVEITPAKHRMNTFIAEIIPHINAMVAATKLPLVNIGVSTSGVVREQKFITAPNLGWEGQDIVTPLERLFDVPITVTSVIEAIAGAEQQAQEPPLRPTADETPHEHRGLVFYVDDSTGTAIHTMNSVELIKVGNYATLAEAAVDLTVQTKPDTVVLAGSAFANPTDAHAVGRALRESPESSGVEVRVIPTHIDNARAAARALALNGLLTDPLGFTKQIEFNGGTYSI
ncbi:MAG: ROK family protein [Corynebacterium sp.]|nr:ROK family protein [Corynebacterium sp.]